LYKSTLSLIQFKYLPHWQYFDPDIASCVASNNNGSELTLTLISVSLSTSAKDVIKVRS